MPVRARDRDRQRVRARERRPAVGMAEPRRRGRGQRGDEPAVGELPHPVAEHPGREAVRGDDDPRVSRRVGELRLDRSPRGSGSRARRGRPSARSPVRRAPARAARRVAGPAGVASQSTRVRPCPTRPRASASRKWSARISRSSRRRSRARPIFSEPRRGAARRRRPYAGVMTHIRAERCGGWVQILTKPLQAAPELFTATGDAPLRTHERGIGMRHPKHVVLLTAVGLFVLAGAAAATHPHPQTADVSAAFSATQTRMHTRTCTAGREHVPRHERHLARHVDEHRARLAGAAHHHNAHRAQRDDRRRLGHRHLAHEDTTASPRTRAKSDARLSRRDRQRATISTVSRPATCVARTAVCSATGRPRSSAT